MMTITRALICAVVASACGGGDAFAPLPECDRSVDAVTVSAGTSPTFDWTPACRLGSLTVFRVSDQQVMWHTRATGYDLGPPVRYGVTPNGLSTTTGPSPLAAGTAYRVAIAVPGTGGPVPVLGMATFTP